ncbi:GTPase Era, mitochondrial [Araneus ventricosus]|uniref:GTPase Era, mitochondrial n=1 Tax=Araneus ventricosus TaxID=182803 RepID=A0A4Y2A811_ARAVE|nr:GTPase Era, mitochondrial [Araneus ventricosus]
MHQTCILLKKEFKIQKQLTPCQPVNPHLLKVSILGEPNVGKSTLTNRLVKWKVCAVSKKVHTTRKKAAAIFVEDNKQIVFLDTPGFVTPELSKKHNLEATFVMDPVRSINEADIIAVVVDISNKWTNNRMNENILEVLEDYRHKKSILILNKIDAMKSKGRLLSFTKMLTGGSVSGIENLTQEVSQNVTSVEDMSHLESLEESDSCSAVTSNRRQKRGWPSFSKVFMVSALKNDGIDELRNYLLSAALPGEWMYHSSTVTDQHPHDIALTTLREKLLEYLPEEIPYKLDLRITKWGTLPTGSPEISVKIICSNSRYKRFVIGPGGRHIANCVEKYRNALKEAFKKDILVHIAVE